MIVADLIAWLKEQPQTDSVFLRINETGVLIDKGRDLYTAPSTFDQHRAEQYRRQHGGE